MSIQNILDNITNDPIFVKQLQDSIKTIMADGVINQKDIPTLILMLTNIYLNVSKFSLTKEKTGELLKLIYSHSVEKYNLIPLNERLQMESLVDMCINLVLVQINFSIPKSCSSFCKNK